MNKILKYIPESIKKFLYKTSLYKKYALSNKIYVTKEEADAILNQAPILLLDEDIVGEKPFIGIVKDKNNLKIGEGEYVNPRASYLRYERFCKNNGISYEFYDIARSDWKKEAEKYDIIVYHSPSNPSIQEMVESKILILEKFMSKTCFPSFHEVWQYEDKIRADYLYKHYNLPGIPTIVTHSKEEVLELIEKIKYPFISKTSIGSASTGVIKINDKKEALNLVNKIFSYKGLKSQYIYKAQKDYLYIQEFIDDATFDLRIILIGNKAFGYYRYPNAGDFRASGSGNYEKKAIPIEALQLAIKVRNTLQSRLMGVDLMYSEKAKQYYIIETSLFNQLDTPRQLEIDGVAGYYDISDIENIVFKEGEFWVQELLLKELVVTWLK